MTRPTRTLLLALALTMISMGSPKPSQADVPEALVAELQTVIDEALASDDGIAQAWALRAVTLLGGRDARTTLEEHLDNGEQLARVFAAIGLIELGRDRGVSALAHELQTTTGSALRLVLDRYVRHLAADKQVEVLEEALEDAGSDSATEILRFVANHPDPAVAGLLADVAPDLDDISVLADVLADTPRAENLDIASALASSRDTGARMAAVQIAAGAAEYGGTDVLLGLLGDSDTDVARQAALALAPHAVPESYALLADLVASGDAASRRVAIAALRDGDPQLVGAETLWGLAESEEDPELRRLLFEAYGATRTDEAYDVLARIATSDVYEERLDGIAGLGFTRREDAVAILSDIVLGGGGEEVRALAAEALGTLGLAGGATPLTDALNRERGGPVKVAALRALGHIPSDDTFWTVAFQLSDTDDEVVNAALETLAALGSPDAAPQVENVVRTHREAAVRWRASLVLFGLDSEGGADLLMAALDDPPDGFQRDLDQLPEALQFDAYRELMGHSDPDVRLLATGRILRSGDVGVQVLRELVQTTVFSDMRQLAISTLTARRDLQDAALFVDFADSSNRAMRSQALEAVVELALSDAEEVLRTLIDSSSDLQVRTIAVYGLWHIGQQ